jgi:hypothetical protein
LINYNKVGVPIVTFWLGTLFLVGCYAISIYAAVFNRALFEFLLSESGPVESLATLFILLSTILFGASYFRHKQQGVLLFLIFSVLVLFVLNGAILIGLQFYFIGVTLLLFVFKDMHSLLLRLKIPVPSPATAFLALINYLLFSYFFEEFLQLSGNLGQTKTNYNELFETGIKLSVLFFAFECFSRGITWIGEAADV